MCVSIHLLSTMAPYLCHVIRQEAAVLTGVV